ncbi:serine/threonine protein kinase [Rhodopirellula maiorica SM1]|uniref:Serine/threonine protein kinase n=1 Tax=Rhodopirellula maiorica SM1 TaxID=1265738 RepID=M5RUA3_9BACT|nr:serine/threonine protein kinase [Rhodopirellula maiorica]EMI22918.1 serine/threonine protein kinase [Rhodopirellula maiorica SM1]
MNNDRDAVPMGDHPAAAPRRSDRDTENDPLDSRLPPAAVQDSIPAQDFAAAQHAEQETLRDCISTAGTLAVADAIFVVDQIAAQLDCWHRRGKAHGAINPSNIFLTDDGFTRIGGDEIARGVSGYEFKRNADVGSDLRNLGWTLRFMLTGRDPEAPTCQSASDLGVANPIFRRLVSRDETDCYRSAAEMRFDLRQRGFDQLEPLATSRESIAAAPQSNEDPVSQEPELRRPNVPRHWVAAAVVVVIVVATMSRRYWMG